MELFDQQILDIRKFIQKKKAEGRVFQEISCAGSPEELLKDFPVRYGSDHPPFVILQEDTFVELGHPFQGSTSTVLGTRQVEMIRDGLITRIGPDLSESAGKSLPFGQIIMIGGAQMDEKEFPRMERARDLACLLEGYMIRQVPQKLWSRVSKEAVTKGFSLGTLGRALMVHYKQKFPLIEAMEILFVTFSKEDVEEVGGISQEAKGKSLTLRKLTRSRDGFYECEDLTCETCADKVVCDTIRDIVIIRKAGKITGIKIIREKNE